MKYIYKLLRKNYSKNISDIFDRNSTYRINSIVESFYGGGTMIEEEKALLEGIRNKKQEVLANVIEKYGKLVLYILKKNLTSYEEIAAIDECYDDVFITVWFNIECFDESRGSLKSWIIGITKFKVLEYRRKLLRHNAHLENQQEILVSQTDNYEFEEQENILKIIEVLEEKDRSIFLLRYIQGCSIEDISGNLGVSKDYIYNRISRGKKKIRENFTEGF